MNPPRLATTHRLALRAIVDDDPHELAAVVSAERSHLASAIALHGDPVARWRLAFEAGERWWYTLRPRAGGPLLGAIAIVPREPGTCALVFWLAAAHTGAGYAREAAAAACRIAFDHLAASRVVIEHAARHKPSAAVAQALGCARGDDRHGIARWELAAVRLAATG